MEEKGDVGEMRQRAGEKGERVGKESGKNLLTAGKAWGEGDHGGKGQCGMVVGSVAWWWHVAQGPDYVGSDHSSSAWQLYSLGQLTYSHLTDEEFSHPYKGRVDGTYFSGLP